LYVEYEITSPVVEESVFVPIEEKGDKTDYISCRGLLLSTN